MNKITWLIIIILWILLGLWLCNKYLCGFTAAAPAAAAAVTPAIIPAKDKCAGPWKFNDQKNFNQSSGSHISFLRSSFNHLTTNPKLENVITKTAEYLKKNESRMLTITGLYESDEKNNSILPDLGMARANDVKAWLSSKGVPGNQLDIKSRLTKDNCFKKAKVRNTANTAAGNKNASMGIDTLTKGIAFAFSAKGNDNSRIDAIKARLLGKPLTVYFQTNSDNINLSAQQRTDVTDIIYYLDNVKGSKLDIGGHTDNVGDRNYNINLSKNRADFVKKYFKDNGGIALNRMAVNGYGPDKPISTNATKEGKALNRRVEATLR